MIPAVYVGTDGWMFLLGGTNNPGRFLEGSDDFGVESVTAWCDLLQKRARAVAPAQYLHFFAPNKETVYAEEAGLTSEARSRSPLARLYGSSTRTEASTLSRLACNPVPYFRQAKGAHQLYWKTDSHWTPTGCFIGYQLLCAKLGVEQVADLLSRPFGEPEILMDLGSKVHPQVPERVRFHRFLREASRVYANAIVRYKEDTNLENEGRLHVGSNVVFQNPKSRDPRRVILFGDSFSEYRPTLLTAMLAETFAELHFVWSTSLDLDYISRHQPDLVLTESVERFMPTIPSDSFNVEAYAEEILARYTPVRPAAQYLEK